jgi:pyruvate/2-oxoglutarate dehydrogenase complex dihydrolipoamide dehydrogenase (E3) component
VEREGEVRRVWLPDGQVLAGDVLLVALGRRPNLDLGLEAAGVAFTDKGVTVDDHLATTNPRVYAAGDVIGQAGFTHAADHQARIVLRNALFPLGGARLSRLVIPRVIYTQPEIAAVGLSADEAARDPSLQVLRVAVGETDRARTDGEQSGFGAVIVDRQGRLRGALVVGEQAGELLSPLTLALTEGLTLGQLGRVITPYPTRSELVFKLASAWGRQRLTPRVAGLMRRYLSWVRS